MFLSTLFGSIYSQNDYGIMVSGSLRILSSHLHRYGNFGRKKHCCGIEDNQPKDSSSIQDEHVYTATLVSMMLATTKSLTKYEIKCQISTTMQMPIYLSICLAYAMQYHAMPSVNILQARTRPSVLHNTPNSRPPGPKKRRRRKKEEEKD